MTEGLIARFRKAFFRRANAKEEIKEYSEEYDVLEAEMLDELVNDGLQSVATKGDDYGPGKTFGVRCSIFASIPVPKMPQGFDLLRELGAGHLVEETVNANSLRAWIMEEIDKDDGVIQRDADGVLVIPPKFIDDADGLPIIAIHEKYRIGATNNPH